MTLIGASEAVQKSINNEKGRSGTSLILIGVDVLLWHRLLILLLPLVELS